jgi:hypothetical protein
MQQIDVQWSSGEQSAEPTRAQRRTQLKECHGGAFKHKSAMFLINP